MSEEIVRALMQLFAIIANVDDEGGTGSSKSVVEAYLKQHLNSKAQEEYLNLFDDFVKTHHYSKSEHIKHNKRTSSNSVKVLMICQQINENLQQAQKVIVLIQLLEFIKNGYEMSSNEIEFVETVAETFNISEQEYFNLFHFIFNRFEMMPKQKRYLLVSDGSENAIERQSFRDGLNGSLHVLHIKSANMYAFKYVGTANLFLNGANIPIDRTLIWDKGSSIRSPKTKPLYYSEIASHFLQNGEIAKISLQASTIAYRFAKSNNGIRPMSFCGESGEMICIMGGSGVGKSTLLSILNGSLKPQQGSVTINGSNIHTEKEKLKGIVGFVPQDDLLIEELTVFQNIYYNAKLCFANLTKLQLQQEVEKILTDLDLHEIKDLTVGSPLNKFISGGQRKRLNIALELIREPAILFVDEPTSGLSSMDSEMVMDLLKEQTLKGKLVITNIHQPSSNIYKMFDKLILLDRGGYLIYYGNPIEAISYFKRKNNFVMADESECQECGNVDTDQILQIVETRVVDEFGKLTKSRKISPKEWYEYYLSEKDVPHWSDTHPHPIPESSFKILSVFKQFGTFITRNVLTKWTNKQYILITFLEAPLLASILGFFSKYIAGNSSNPSEYIFSKNENLPAFLFMSVVCALFIGLTISAEEIIKDRKLLERERFLNLSKWSYLNAKIVLLFLISAIQTLSFVLIANYILEIQGLTFNMFLVLFSTACFANMLGLNISASLNSVVTIYITIPFILVPQLLLSGVIVKFEKLHKSIANYQYVSLAGDIMVSRWAYEALAVNQFKNNFYQKQFFELNRALSNVSYVKDYLIPKLLINLDFCKTAQTTDSLKQQTMHQFRILQTEIERLERKYGFSFPERSNLTIQKFDTSSYNQTKNYLKAIKTRLDKKHNQLYDKRENRNNLLLEKLGKDAYIQLKENNYNEAIADQVLNKNEIEKIIQIKNRYVQYMEPIYIKPEHPFGRTPLYASKKRFLGNEIDTVWFNVFVIWIGTILLYIFLINDIFATFLLFLKSMYNRTK